MSYIDIPGSGPIKVTSDETLKAASESKSALDDWPWTTPPPSDFLLGGWGLDPERATGIPALLGVFRILSGGAGQVPIKVYRGADVEDREEARKTWQWKLLHKKPHPGQTAFSFKADFAAKMLGYGEAFIVKVKPSSGGLIPSRSPRVLGLKVLRDSSRVDIDRVGTRKVYTDRSEVLPNGEHPKYREDEIIHVRTFSFDGERGVSPITQVREALTTSLRRIAFERRFVENDARPPAIMSFPTQVTEDQARAWLEMWNAQHQGPENAGEIGVIGGGAELKSVPLSNLDALFVDATQLSVRQVAAMYQVPPVFVAGHDRVPAENEWRFLTTFGLGPIFTALDEALAADDDLFPANSDLFPESLPDALVKTDLLTKYQAYRVARQGGWLVVNEIRRKENLKPKPGGDKLQETPVGGAPNRDRGQDGDNREGGNQNGGGDQQSKALDYELLAQAVADELELRRSMNPNSL